MYVRVSVEERAAVCFGSTDFIIWEICLAASEPGKVQLTALGRQLQKDLLVEYAPVAPPKRRKTMPVAIEMGDAVGGRRWRNINKTPANEGKSNAPQSSNAMDDVSSSSDSSGDSSDESWENAPIMEEF